MTGPDWRASEDGPWVSAGIYAGESFDQRRLPAGWAAPGFEGGWDAVAVAAPGPVPGPRTGPEVRVTQVLPVATVTQSPSGTTLLDFGQNLVGRLRLTVDGPAGTEITMRHASTTATASWGPG